MTSRRNAPVCEIEYSALTTTRFDTAVDSASDSQVIDYG